MAELGEDSKQLPLSNQLIQITHNDTPFIMVQPNTLIEIIKTEEIQSPCYIPNIPEKIP